MGKKSKSKSDSNTSKEEEESTKQNDSSDIFKLLFGRETREEPGLGLRGIGDETDLQPETDNGDSSNKKKKKKRDKSPELADESSEKPKKRKSKSKEESEPIDVESEDKAKKKKKLTENKDLKPVSDGSDNIGDIVPTAENEEAGDLNEKKEKKKKKRKRDEIEEAYEAKTYGGVATHEGKKDTDNNKSPKVGQKRKTLQDPAAMTVSKDEFDDETKLLRTIFVGNLPLKFKKKTLLKEFTKFGDVESVRIRSVPIVDSKTPRKGAIMKGKINEAVDSVHAYIVFKDEKSAQASLSHNMAVVGGNHIRVDKACPPRKKLKGDSSPVYDNQRTVFVGNLPFDVKDEELYQLFCGINQLESSIEAVRVIRDPNSSVGKGIAYVLFKTKEAANLVIRKRNLKIRDRDLRVYHAKSNATPSKKRSLPTAPTGNSPGKRLAVTSSGNKTQSKAALSYQGLKASKSIQQKEGKKKDDIRPRSGGQGKRTPGTPSRAEVKQTKTKRPAVAARKAKALKSAGASRQTGFKRKPERHTPDKFRPKKKARK